MNIVSVKFFQIAWQTKSWFIIHVVMLVLFFVLGWFSACRNTSKEQELIEVKELIDSAERQHDANNILASFEILSKAREKAHKNKFTEEYMVCLNMLSRLYAYIDDFEEAMQLNEETYAIATDKNDSLAMMKTLNNKGVIISMAGRQQEALNIFQNLLQLAVKLKDPDMTAIASRNIAGIEINLVHSPHALALIDSALQTSTFSKGEEYYWELQNMRAGIIKSMGDSEKPLLSMILCFHLYLMSLIYMQRFFARRHSLPQRVGTEKPH